MRYIKIVFLCDPLVTGYMEVDEQTGILARLTDDAGATLNDPLPAKEYSVYDANPVKPGWGT